MKCSLKQETSVEKKKSVGLEKGLEKCALVGKNESYLLLHSPGLSDPFNLEGKMESFKKYISRRRFHFPTQNTWYLCNRFFVIWNQFSVKILCQGQHPEATHTEVAFLHNLVLEAEIFHIVPLFSFLATFPQNFQSDGCEQKPKASLF